MSTRDNLRDERGPKAAHGYRNEVSWRGGQGRQPYTNQPEADRPEDREGASANRGAHAFAEVPQGDRGMHSGVNQEQMREARSDAQREVMPQAHRQAPRRVAGEAPGPGKRKP